MAIQFTCPGCSKTLSVPDAAVGKKARCPHCTTVVQVPQQSTSDPADEYQLAPPEAGPPAPSNSAPGSSYGASTPSGFPDVTVPQKPVGSDNPYASPTMGYEQPWPYQTGQSTPLAFEAAFSVTWEIFKEQMGTVIATVLIVAGINIVIAVVSVGVALPIQQEAPELGMLVDRGFQIISWLVNTFMMTGQSIVLLNIARGRPAEIGDVFAGGPYYLRMLGASFLFNLMVGLGACACIIPGIILALMFGQFMMLIIDRDLGVMDSLTESQNITEGNKWTLFLIGLVGGLLGLVVTVFTLGIGLIFVGPYLALMAPVIYLMMTGQPLAKTNLGGSY